MAGTDILTFIPQFKERLWGGRRLASLFPDRGVAGAIGEAWLVSAIPASESVVAAGAYAGRTLADLYAREPALFPHASGAFPLLVKLIDAADRLSVQVHPDDADALRLERQSGKSECWFVLDAAPDAELVVGHRARSREELAKATLDGTLDGLLDSVRVRRGDFIHIPAGTIHAIGAGLLLLEIQQSSDVTYRLYDYGRKDAAGKTRELHLDKAVAVSRVPAVPVEIRSAAGIDAGLETLVDSPHFVVSRLVVRGRFAGANPWRDWFIGTVVRGEARIQGERLVVGRSFLVPSGIPTLVIEGDVEIVVAALPEVRR